MSGTTSAIVAVSDIAALRAASTTTLPNAQCYVVGYYTISDGGEGIFVYQSSDTTSSDNGGTIIVDASARRWYRSLGSQPVSVNQFGATANGGVNAAPFINAAISYVASTGGGVISFRAGTYTISQSLTLMSKVGLQGQGHGRTIVRGASGTTMDLLQSYQFSTLTGSNSPSGPYQFTIEGITFDANKGNRLGGRCAALYGYDYVLRDCEFSNAFSDGLYSEWATSGSVPVAAGGNGMEARIENCKFFQNGGNGLTFNGPHDTDILNTLYFLNTGSGAIFSETTAYSGGCNLITAHAYGNSAAGIVVDTGVNMSQVQSESNLAGGGIQVTSSGFIIGSDLVAYSNTGFGISIGGSGSKISGIFVTNNSSDGLALIGSANLISDVLATSNKDDGVNATSTANSTVISGLLAQSNTSFGLAISASDFAVSGIYAAFNQGGGVAIANGLGSVRLSGEINNNGNDTAQVQFGNLGSGCMIDLSIFTVSGQAAYAGAYNANFVRAATLGAGSGAPINNAPVPQTT